MKQTRRQCERNLLDTSPDLMLLDISEAATASGMYIVFK